VFRPSRRTFLTGLAAAGTVGGVSGCLGGGGGRAKWAANIGPAGPIHPRREADEPQNDSSPIYVGTDGALHAILNGESTWTYDDMDGVVPHRPVYREDGLYVSPEGGGVHAVDTEGTRRWVFDRAETGVPYPNGDYVYAFGGGTLSILNREDGSVSETAETDIEGTADVSVDSSRMYLTTQNQVVALDYDTHERRWSHEIRPGTGIVRSFEGVILSSAEIGGIADVDPLSGNIDWSGRHPVSTPTYFRTNQRAYVTERERPVVASVDREGNRAWQTTLENVEDPAQLSRPAPGPESVYVLDRGADRLYAVSRSDGTPEWSAGIDASVREYPAVGLTSVYVPTESGVIALGT